MANTIQTAIQAPAASSDRRIGALKAFFLSQDIESISQIDFGLELLKNATVHELQFALEAVAEVRKTRLADRIRKWMGDSDHMIVGDCATEEWMPVERARLVGLKKRPIHGMCMLIYNQLEVYQVSYVLVNNPNNRNLAHLVYHIQPLTTPSESGYYHKEMRLRNSRWMPITQPMRAINLPDDCPQTRYFRGTITQPLAKKIITLKCEPVVDPRVKPLHDLIIP